MSGLSLISELSKFQFGFAVTQAFDLKGWFGLGLISESS